MIEKKPKNILAEYIIKNIHACPFGDESGIDFEKDCAGFGSARCPGCIVENAARLEKPGRNLDKYGNDLSKLKPGDYVLYQNGSRFELGRVKRVDFEERKAFVWYSSGDTAARTDFSDLVRLENARDIKKTALGGADAEEMFV